MRRLLRLSILLAALLTIIGCEKVNNPGDKVLHWPFVKTLKGTYINDSTAIINGQVNASDLSTSVTFEYGTTTSYGNTVTAHQSPVTGNNLTNVSATITGLIPFTCYHFRVKAENSIWKNFYGSDNIIGISDVVFPNLKLLQVYPKTSTCVGIEGQVVSIGTGCENAPRGVCWSTTPDPTIYDNKTTGTIVCSTCSGSYFAEWLYDLCSGRTYYVRAYVTCGSFTAYSNQLSFTTISSGKPIINAAIFPPSLSCTGAIVAFDIADNGGNCPITEEGVCYATTPNPTIENTIGNNEYFYYDLDINNFIWHSNSRLYDLQPATLYHVRPYFIADAGTFYGEDLSFTTNSLPTVITVGATKITSTTAEIKGNVTSTGGSFVVSRGVCFSQPPIPAGTGGNDCIEQEVQSTDGAGEFSVNLINLTPGTLYHVRAFVAVMTGLYYGDQIYEYGNEVSFTTKP